MVISSRNVTDAIEAGARAIYAKCGEYPNYTLRHVNDLLAADMAKACIEAAIASGELVPASEVAVTDCDIERVAKAIQSKDFENYGAEWECLSECGKADFRAMALAAIEATRQISPTISAQPDIKAQVAGAVAEMRERCAKVVDNFHSCSDIAAAIRQLDISTASGDCPDWDDVRGIAPNATGDKSSEEFIRDLRDGWDDTAASSQGGGEK